MNEVSGKTHIALSHAYMALFEFRAAGAGPLDAELQGLLDAIDGFQMRLSAQTQHLAAKPVDTCAVCGLPVKSFYGYWQHTVAPGTPHDPFVCELTF